MDQPTPHRSCHFNFTTEVVRSRILLILIGCQFLAVYATHGQYLINEFKPKIKGAPHTAKHIVQADGKLVMLGDYGFVGDTPRPNLLRFESDGSLDDEFNLSEDLRDQFTTDFRQCCSRANVIEGPDGDLVLLQATTWQGRATIIDKSGEFKADIALPLGYFQFEQLIRYKDGYIAAAVAGSVESIIKLDKNGNIDPAFTRFDFVGYVDQMVVDPNNNNNILVAGSFTISGATRNFIRINELGVLDNTFNNVSIPASFTEIDFFPDGKIVVSSDNNIVLLDANGNSISSFTPDTDGERIYSSVIDVVNNRIIILIEQYPRPVAVKALEMDGSISDLFTPIEIGVGTASALARILRIDQKFVLTTDVWQIKYGTEFYSFLVFDGTGNVDNNISLKEKIFNVGYVNAAVELEDGNLIVGGSFSHIGNTQVNNLAKLDKSGNVNSTFAGNNPLSISDEVKQIELSPDNQLYVGGFFHDILGTTVNSLIRTNTDGQLDESFVTNLTSTASYGFLDDFIIMPDRIIACGNYDGNVVAFDFSGNRIAAFNTNIFESQWVIVKSLCKIDEDNFAIGGYVPNAQGFLWIMDIDGVKDNSFVQQNEIPISSEHMVKVGNGIYRSGSILGGQSSGDPNFIYKYNLETGIVGPTNLGTYTMSENHHLLPLSDNKLVISGMFDHFNNVVANNFVVSDYAGVSNERFNFQVSPGVADHQVSRTVLLSDERIVLLGHFDKINNEPFYSIAMINYTDFKPRLANLREIHSVDEDTNFYLSDIAEIIDIDDELHFSAMPNNNLTVSGSGLVTLKPNFNGSVELQFKVGDSSAEIGPFSTTIEVRPVNDAPVINSQLEVPAILPGETYNIGFGVLDVIDVDGDELTLMVHDGQNYALSGGTSITSDINFHGNLKVGVSVSDGLLSSELFMMNVDSGVLTGIEEIPGLAVYPNPFSEYIKINSWENVEHLTIGNIDGQEVIEYDYEDLSSSSGVIHSGMLPAGMMLLNVVMKTGELKHIKLVKK